MLLVCLGHFTFAHFPLVHGHYRGLPLLLSNVSKIATPTFMTVSGLMLGFLHATRGSGLRTLAPTLVDRALFMLTAGHLIILLAHLPITGDGSVWRWAFVTDTIALNVLLGCALIGRTGPRLRAALGAAAVVATVPLDVAWRPENGVAVALKETLVGAADLRVYTYVFPILPWFGAYVLSTALGEALGGPGRLGRRRDMTRLVLRTALVALGIGVAGGAVAAEGALGLADLPAWMAHEASPFSKLPPTIPYLGLYGGLGLLLLAFYLAYETERAVRPLVRATAVLGRTSLFVFVIQYYAYYGILPLLGLGGAAAWGYFVVAIAVIWSAAACWDARGGNRWLTVGYARRTGNPRHAAGIRTTRGAP
jgi:uncharacterized membrane protein